MAVQGGLLASTIAQGTETREKKKREKGNALPIIIFLVSKVLAYTILGFLLGWFGSLLQLSLPIQILMQLVVVIFMIGTALNILEVHPVFRYFVIQPPKFLARLVRRQSKGTDIFAPGILGAFTIFIPCGTTQAMMALAIASGNPFVGASILFFFILGTAPLFFLLGYFATKLSTVQHGRFMRIAAFAILILAIFNLNNALSLTGKGILPNPRSTIMNSNKATTEATINIEPAGYNPPSITLQSNSQVTLNIVNKGAYTCASAFTIPDLGIQKIVQPGSTERIQFKTPDSAAQIPFMCSMGMYRGVINVVKN